MSPDDFDRLVSKHEIASQRAPTSYPAKVGTMAVLGYFVVFLLFVGATALAVGCGALMVFAPKAATIKLGLVGLFAGGAIALGVIRALWVPFERVEGRRISRKDAPALFAELDALRKSLRVGTIHRVLVTPELNACVQQSPRLGIFGWYDRSLVLGLPLLQAFSPDEFRSIIAHEFGHLSGEHGRFMGWVYRVRVTWLKLVAHAQQSGRGLSILGPFLRWWWPRFDAMTFVLSRKHEYEADAAAVRTAGPQVAGTALVRVNTLARQLDDNFWPNIRKAAAHFSEPPDGVYGMLAASLRAAPPEDSARWLREALALPTNNADTHPCLRDRLAGMKFTGVETLSVPPPPARSAAEVFFGPLDATLTAEFSAEWKKTVSLDWKEVNADAAKSREGLDELAKSEQSGSLTVAERWKKILLIANVDGDEAVLPLLREFIRAEPEHAAANYHLGRILLQKDDESGMDHVERAMRRDPMATSECCGMMHAFLQRKGRHSDAKAIERRVYEHDQTLERAAAERGMVDHKTRMLAHGLEPDEQKALVEVVEKYPEIARVDVARADVRIMPDSPYSLVSVTVKVPWWKFRSDGADRTLVMALVEALPIPNQFVVFTISSETKKLAKAIALAPGSCVFERRK